MVGVVATQLLDKAALPVVSDRGAIKPVEEVLPNRFQFHLQPLFNEHNLETVRAFWRCLARLGGFIGRKSDGRPE